MKKMNFIKKEKLCYACRKKIRSSNKKYYKVQDYCHYTGKYRGSAHNICNLRYKTPKEILVILHNGSNYDDHLIIKEMAIEFKG